MNAGVQELLAQLRNRSMAFDLMIQFLDRALEDGYKDAYLFFQAASMIHRGS